MDDPSNVALAHWFSIPMEVVCGIQNIICTMAAYEGDDTYAFVLYQDGSGYYVVDSSYCSCCSSPDWEPRKIERSEIQQLIKNAADIVAGMT